MICELRSIRPCVWLCSGLFFSVQLGNSARKSSWLIPVSAPERPNVTSRVDESAGVSGYDVAETTDEKPERVAALARLAWAYLRSEPYPGDSACQAARDAVTAGP